MQWPVRPQSRFSLRSLHLMNKECATDDFPMEWASKKDRQRGPVTLPQTGFFLLGGNPGVVVTRKTSKSSAGPIESGPVTRDFPVGDYAGSSSTISSPVRIPRATTIPRRVEQRYILLKKYEGFVTSREGDGFSVRLFESQTDHPVIEADFALEELAEQDRELAVEGAPLVWTIGYIYEGGTRKRQSWIYMRRLPAWTESELEQGERAAEDLTRAIRWE